MTIVVHTYMLIQLYQFQTAMQCAPVDDANKKKYLKIVPHLLIAEDK